MKDQVSVPEPGAGVHAAYLNSSLTAGQYYKALGYAREGRYPIIIYAAPEAASDPEFLLILPSMRRSPWWRSMRRTAFSPVGPGFPAGMLKDRGIPAGTSGSARSSAPLRRPRLREVRDDIIDLLKLQDPACDDDGI
ncbi:MAG: hypothetical protein ACLUAR_16865 [Pilosibacter sp.]